MNSIRLIAMSYLFGFHYGDFFAMFEETKPSCFASQMVNHQRTYCAAKYMSNNPPTGKQYGNNIISIPISNDSLVFASETIQTQISTGH